jgi:hypothetical protein
MSRQQRQQNAIRKQTKSVRVILFNNKSTNRNHDKMNALRRIPFEAYISSHA